MKRAVVVAAMLIAIALAPRLASAFVLTLAGPGGEGTGLNDGLAAVIYAAVPNHPITPIAALGDIGPDGSTIVDLGVPSVSPDGTVVFAADSRRPGESSRWQIFTADPADPSHRLLPLLRDAAVNPECAPSFRVDPYPAGGSRGEVVFLAPSAGGPDALFHYSDGELRCVARVGDTTLAHSTLTLLAFGSLRVIPNGDMVLAGRVRDSHADRDVDALLLAHAGGEIEEIAREGAAAPGGGRYRGPFNFPAAGRIGDTTAVAFTDRTTGGARLFLYQNGRVRRITGAGAATKIGRINFLSPTEPAIARDGTVAVIGQAGSTAAVFVARGNSVRPVAWQGEKTGGGSRASSFEGLVFDASGALFAPLNNLREETELSRISRAGALSNHATLQSSKVPLFAGTLTGNESGTMVFMGPRTSGIENVSERFAQ